jgi:hypothetical protein
MEAPSLSRGVEGPDLDAFLSWRVALSMIEPT